MNVRQIHRRGVAASWIILLWLSWSCVTVFGQEDPVPQYRYEGGYVIVEFDQLNETENLDRLLQNIGSNKKMADSLRNVQGTALTSLGWELIRYDEEKLAFRKALKELAHGAGSWFFLDEAEDFAGQAPYELDVPFGVNSFRKPSIQEKDAGYFTFHLFDHSKAKQVFLSGSFNNWSTMRTPMQRSGDSWSTTLPLQPGKHLYKFIVDGQWMTDPANTVRETDRMGNTNSVFYGYNYTFTLKGYPNAKRVFLAGSFNNWRPRQLQLQATDGGWSIDVYLREGVHTYKFIVDGNWITDPGNPNTRPDGEGNDNSFLSFGKPYEFATPRFESARSVVLSGDFNGWNPAELIMNHEWGEWILPIALRPGNYQYKYIVDGQWKIDPDNPHTIGSEEYINSVLSVRPNHTFILKGYDDASEVLLSGTFNNWAEDGYTMKRTNDGWLISIHLPKGKTRYKFIVDGKWITDPDNELWEVNQYGTHDSILWIE